MKNKRLCKSIALLASIQTFFAEKRVLHDIVIIVSTGVNIQFYTLSMCREERQIRIFLLFLDKKRTNNLTALFNGSEFHCKGCLGILETEFQSFIPSRSCNEYDLTRKMRLAIFKGDWKCCFKGLSPVFQKKIVKLFT